MFWQGLGIGTGLGDDFPAGYSLGQGGWGSGFDFTGDLMSLFNITMMNCTYFPANYTAGGSVFGGMMGGIGGQSPFACSYAPNFSTGMGISSSTDSTSSTKKTADERKAEVLAKGELKDKHKALKDLLTKYLNTLDTTSSDYKSLEYDLNTGYKAVNEENYTKLKDYYNTNKDKIQKAILATDEYKKVTSIGDGKYFNNKSNINTDELLNGEELNSDVDVMELIGDFKSENINGFFYKKDGLSDTQKNKLRKANKAIYKALKKEVESIKGNTKLSPETKAALEKTLTICSESDEFYADKNSKPYIACTAMYYWVRIAKAEVLDRGYACLKDDFSDDGFLGKGGAVEAVKNDLYTNEHFTKNGYCAKQKYD